MPTASPATGGPRRCCREESGRAAVGLSEDERFVGLLHLGRPRQEDKPPPERPPAEQTTVFLD